MSGVLMGGDGGGRAAALAPDRYGGDNGGGGRQPVREKLGKMQLDNGQTVDLDELLTQWKERETQARNDRRRYEAAWHLATAFVAGRQWVGWDPKTRRVILEPNPRKRERHTVNVLTRYFWAQIGKVYGEEFKPDLWFARTDQMAQDYVNYARKAYDFAWDVEVRAEELIFDLIIETFAYGTAAMRACYNPAGGKYLGQLPMKGDGSGREYDLEKARAIVSERKYYGEDPQLDPVWEGRCEWEVLSPMNLLVPPGLPYARQFPWLIVDSLMTLDDIHARYPDTGKDVSEETLATVDLLGLRDIGGNDEPGAASGVGKLRNHAVVHCGYGRPTMKFPKGVTIEYTQDRVLDVKDELPINVNGQWQTGVVFFHYNRLPRRFWSQGLIEPGIGPQRQRNRARSQQIEMKDKNLGRVYAWKGTITEQNRPTGKIMELIEVSRSAPGLPTETEGVSPGPWIAAETQQNDADLDKVMGTSDIALGQAPRGVSAYSAFALLAEADDRRVGPILKAFRGGMIDLSQITMAYVKRYWPDEKNILLAGEEDEPDAFVFNVAQLPEAVYFRFGSGGPPTPKSPAAQIQLVFDLFDRSVSSGKPLPLDWLYNSLKQGKPLPLPDDEVEGQKRLAELENQLANEGHQIQVHPSDNHPVHIPEHQECISALALIPGAEPVLAILQQHIAQHEQAAATSQQAATSVPGLQGPMGALGAPQAAPPPGDSIVPMSQLLQDFRAGSHANNLSPQPGNVQ